MAGPLIDEKYVDAASQRLYAVSLGLLCQAIKFLDFLQYLVTPAAHTNTSYVRKWMVVDALCVLGLAQLRIPRITYSKSALALQLSLLAALDGLLFGGLVVDVGLSPFVGETSAFTLPALTDVLSTVGLGALVPTAASHLMGQHTVRMSPVSTAELNAEGQKFCLSSQIGSVMIPVLLNNTNPSVLRYSLSPLDSADGETVYIDLNAKDLRHMDDAGTVQRTAASSSIPEIEEDEYDDDDSVLDSGPLLQKTQTVAHIRVSKPGVLRLEKVVHSNSVEARVTHRTAVVIAPCPSAAFVDDARTIEESSLRCSGSNEDVHMNIDVRGVPPLSLRWSKRFGTSVEHFDVEGIDSHRHDRAVTRSSSPSRSSQNIRIPLTVSATSVGHHSYTLESVSDGLGNVVHLASSNPAAGINKILHPIDFPSEHAGAITATTTRSVRVLPRARVFFQGCSASNPARLLKGQDATVILRVTDIDDSDSPLQAIVTYNPLAADEDPSVVAEGAVVEQAWTRTVQIGGSSTQLQVGSPGEYTITSAQGTKCEAEVLSPDVCKLVELPRPSADIEWQRIHECSGDTGVSASIVLHGAPPFQVFYRTQRDQEQPREQVKTIYGSRGDLKLQPEHSGHYVYTFVSLSDANYKKIPLGGPSIEQSVHPLASVDFSHKEQGGRQKQINSCSGSTVDIDIELKGAGPWNVEVQVVDAAASQTIPFNGIVNSRKTLTIPLPKRIDKEGGLFTVDLVSVEDSNGCKRQVSVPGVSINVNRIKSTVRFYGKNDRRRATVLQRQKTSLPLRLTGDGPWFVKYRRLESPERVENVKITSPNGQLEVVDDGTYELVGVSDSHCAGSVVNGEDQYTISWIGRPLVKLASETPVTLDAATGSYSLPEVCENLDDHVDLDLTGHPPFQVVYNIARDDMTGSGTELIEQTTLNSIQSRTRFQLLTTEPGRKYYEVKQIGDASYPITKNQHTIIPRAERLLFSQNVLRRPSAAFKQRNRLSYCHGDSFVSKSSYDGIIVFSGAPPFEARISIRDLAAGETQEETMTVLDSTWSLSLPGYTFKSSGPHLVTIESVQDAAGCEQAALDPLKRTLWVDVLESAAIVPYDRREHFCVGDLSQFQLEGSPPWTIGYTLNGKSHTKQASESPFSMVQQQAGDFAIHSIAHQQKMCTTAIKDLQWAVHPLPYATVGHGKRVIQDIYEGDQAEIVFSLTGEPPFTFTYQRTELTTKKGRVAKVLETHTVTGVTKKEYSIYSALEGTWTVTFISDRYCRYPPIQNNVS